jgi:hypothetical protein
MGVACVSSFIATCAPWGYGTWQCCHTCIVHAQLTHWGTAMGRKRTPFLGIAAQPLEKGKISKINS